MRISLVSVMLSWVLVVIGKLLSKLPGGSDVFKAFSKVLPEEELANPVVATNAWRTFAQNLAISTAEQTAIFGAGATALDIAAKRTAEQLSGLSYDHSKEPGVLQQIGEGAANFLPTALVMGAGAGAIRLPFDLAKERKYDAQQAMADIKSAVEESKTAQRSPEAMADFVNNITKNTPAEEMRIPANEWVRYWQEKMPEDETAAVAMAEKAGVSPQDAAEAIATGGDIAIKSGDFAKTFANTEHYDGLMPDVKIGGEDFTAREKETAVADSQERMQSIVDAAEGKTVDKASDLYTEAMNAARAAYPDAKNEKVLEKQANLIYAMFNRADDRGVFDALGIPNASEALRQLTVKKLNVPSKNPLLYQYAGERSASADHLNLNQAKRLEQSGVSNEDIRQKTGWFKGMDNKWRYEIDDSKASYKAPEEMTANLDEVFSHPDLYKAYPDLRSVRVTVAPVDENIKGAYDRDTNEIFLNENMTDKEKQETLLHEIQHAIQQREKFASGGSPETSISESRVLGEDGYERLAGEIEARDSSERSDLSMSDRRDTPPDLRGDAIVIHNGKEFSYNTGEKKAALDDNLKRGEDAIKNVLEKKSDVDAAMYRPETGWIDFVWGDQGTADKNFENGFGIAKILKKHPDALNKIPEVISKGTAEIGKFKDRVYFSLGDMLAVVRLTWDGEKRTWLLTGFEKEKKPLMKSEDVGPSDSTLNERSSIEGAGASDTSNIADQSAKSNGGKLFQTNTDPLASYTPTGTGKGVIELYKNANYSSLSHEMMHHFVHLYHEAVASNTAKADVAKDYKALQDFAGNKGEDWSRAQHEKIADAWEKYLSEGKAPSLELVGVFDKFKTWLKNIYKQLTGQGYEINDDVRQVFDRMLASDEQIAQAEMFYGSERLMGGKSMGLASMKQYVSTLTKAHEQAQKTMYDKALADMQPEFKKRLVEVEKKAIADESRKMRTQEPLYMAREAMEYEKDLPPESPGAEFVKDNGGPLKLNREATESRYGKGAVPNHFLSKDGKFTLDDIADIYGFQSGDDLRQAIANNKPFGEELNKRVAAKMADFKQQEIGNMHDEAIKAVHNDYSLEAVAIEAEAIKKAMADLEAKNKEKLAADWQKAKDQNEGAKPVQAKLDEAQQKIADAKTAKQQEDMVRQGRLNARAAREAAVRLIESKPIGESGNWKKYIQQSVKAGKDADKALRKGDYTAALRFKDQEVLSHALAMAASKAEKEISGLMRFFNTFDKRGNDMKGIPHEFNRQIDNLLYQHNLIRREPIAPLDPQNVLTLHDFVEDCKQNYFYPQIADSVLGDTTNRHYTRLNLPEMRDLKDSVKSIKHVGKIMDKALADDRTETMKERIAEISSTLGEKVQRYTSDFAAGKAELSILDRLGRIPDMFNTSLVKMESFCRVIDGGKTGPMTKYVLWPIYNALDGYHTRVERMSVEFKDLMDKTGFSPKEIAQMGKDKVHFDFMKNDLSMAEIVQMALNWGNEGNRDRIRRGYFLDKDQQGRRLEDFETHDADAKVARVLSELSEKHWNFVQNVWDYLNTYAPEVRQHELSITGIDPKMVDALPFQIVTKDGKALDLKGGYYPLAYDPSKSVEAHKTQEALNALYISNPATRAQTQHGHTENRVSTLSRPVLLDWSVLTNHLNNVIYDLNMRKAIIDVNRLLNNDQVKSGIASTIGVKTHNEMMNWLKNIASDQSDPIGSIEKVLRGLRRNTTRAALGIRIKALFEDLPINVVQAFWQFGIADTGKAMAEYYRGNWKEQKAFVDDKSAMMRERLSFLDRDIADFSRNVFDNKDLHNKAEKFWYMLDAVADGAITYPLWQKAYSKALAEGMADRDAVMEADGLIRRTTADGSKAGLVAMQRGPEAKKLMTMFYTWYSGLFNRFWVDTKLAQENWAGGNKVAATNTMLRAALYGWVIPGVWGGVVKAGLSNTRTKDKKKEEENQLKNFASGALTQPFGTVPVLGSAASYGVNRMLGQYDSYSFSPVEDTIQKIVGSGEAVVKYFNAKPNDRDAGQKLTEALANSTAYAVGYPTRINAWAFNALDYLNGKGDAAVADFISRRHYNK